MAARRRVSIHGIVFCLFCLALSAFTAIAISTAISPAMADDYPSRPIRLIIPFPPGGSNDVVGRIVANQLGQKLGQTVFVDNRAGAGGVVGTDVAAKSTPDGYTLLAHAVDPWIYQETFDPIKDFVPVAILATGTNVLTVNPNVPVHSVKELIDLAESKPGFLNYASAGIGSFQNLGGELFKVLAGVDIVHVPYKGGGPSMLAVIAGEAQMMFSSIVQTVSNIQGGRLRALATGGAKRSPILPDLPTISEAGVPDYVAGNSGAGRHAGADCRQAAWRNRGRFALGGYDEKSRSAGRHAVTHEFCRIRRLHPIGNGQVGTCGQKSRHESGVSIAFRYRRTDANTESKTSL